MDTAHYATVREPFLNKPSPKLFFESENHAKAWQFLKSGLKSEEPHLMVAGPYGAGKTLLCLKLVERLKKRGNQPFVYVSTPAQSYADMLRQACSALKLKVSRSVTNPETLASRIYRHFEENPDDSLLILLDDVQEYNARTLNQIRMLANYNAEGRFPIRLFLFAHLDFSQRLKSADLEPLNQRIKRRFYLEGMSFEEVKEYIYFQMLEAGTRGSPFFPDDTIREIVRLSEGLPRRINNICDMCLLIGDNQGADSIDRSILAEAARQLGLEAQPPVSTFAPAHDVEATPKTAHSTPGDTLRHDDSPEYGSAPDQPGHYIQVDDGSQSPNAQTPDIGLDGTPGNTENRWSRPDIDLSGMAPWATWLWRIAVVALLMAIVTVALADGADLSNALSELYKG